MPLKLLAFVLPLGLHSFAVAAAIGSVQVTTLWQRLRISLIFVIFEGGMPLVGLALGAALAQGIGTVAGYIASQSLAQLVAMLPAAERAALNAAVPALVHLRELDGGAVRSADAGHGPVVDRIGHQGMAR